MPATTCTSPNPPPPFWPSEALKQSLHLSSVCAKLATHLGMLIATTRRCRMPTQTLPAASLRSARCLPAAQTLLRAANYLICTALWSIRQAFWRVASNFLPALREGCRYQAASSGVRIIAGPSILRGLVWTKRSCIDEKGKPVAWNRRLAGSSVSTRWLPPAGADPECDHFRRHGSALWRDHAEGRPCRAN